MFGNKGHENQVDFLTECEATVLNVYKAIPNATRIQANEWGVTVDICSHQTEVVTPVAHEVPAVAEAPVVS